MSVANSEFQGGTVGGDSGGPLFDMFGKVIGIHSRINPTTRDGQFVGNFHVPVDVYSETWDTDEFWELYMNAQGEICYEFQGLSGNYQYESPAFKFLLKNYLQ